VEQETASARVAAGSRRGNEQKVPKSISASDRAGVGDMNTRRFMYVDHWSEHLKRDALLFYLLRLTRFVKIHIVSQLFY
jgi:hypothetical protein